MKTTLRDYLLLSGTRAAGCLSSPRNSYTAASSPLINQKEAQALGWHGTAGELGLVAFGSPKQRESVSVCGDGSVGP